MVQVRNPVLHKKGETDVINCEVFSDVYGWAEYTATNYDPAEFGQSVYKEALAQVAK